jgi:hypothetical protein
MLTDVSSTLPRDPLARFLSIAKELAAHKQWFEGPTVIRYAALALLVAEGDAASLAGRVAADSLAISKQQTWFSDLRGAMRFVIAGWLAASRHEPAGFTAACEAIRGRFRIVGVRRGGAYEIVAATMLHVADAGDEAHVRRLQQLYEMMKRHHWWLTNPDDLPACALLSVRGGDLVLIEQRIEAIYARLRESGLSAGAGLQMASHILAMAPGSDADVVNRFRALHDGFIAAGIQMWDTDFDEVALLCTLHQDAAQTVRTVVDHRAQIKEQLRVAGATVNFSLACGTAFFAAHSGQVLDKRMALDVELATLAMAANAAHLHEASKRSRT